MKMSSLATDSVPGEASSRPSTGGSGGLARNGQLVFDFDSREPLRRDTGLGEEVTAFPQFRKVSPVQSDALRMAGRINAASISDAEHDALLEERQSLLDRKFAEGLSARESNRLEYIRWTLDRIEDAKYGSTLDALENSVERYEQFLSDLKLLEKRLAQAARMKR